MAAKAKIPQLSWSDVQPVPVMLVTGPEQLFADRAWLRMRSILREQDPALEIHEVEASQYESGMLMTLASPSLFGEPRLIRVMGAEKATDAFITDAKAYLEVPDADTTLVIRHGGGQRGKGLLDAIRAMPAGAVEVLCPAVKPGDLPALVRAEFHRLGVKADPRAMQALVQAFPENLEELIAVCGQLAQNSGGNVTLSQVEIMTGGRVETNAFKVADAAIAGNAGEALLFLRQALDTGVQPIPLLGALNYKLRAIARVCGAEASAAQLAKEFGMPPWQVDRAMRDVRGWRESGLARVMTESAATDLALKGGSRDAVYALERFVLLVARKGAPLPAA